MGRVTEERHTFVNITQGFHMGRVAEERHTFVNITQV